MSEHSLPTELPARIRDHVRRYLESDGRDGHLWDSSVVGGSGPVPTLLLTTTGRKSGKTQNGYGIVAGKRGAPSHPAWYLNLTARPDAKVQVEAKRIRARARTATGSERSALWDQMVRIFPLYTEYQKRTEREFPVVVLETAGD